MECTDGESVSREIGIGMGGDTQRFSMILAPENTPLLWRFSLPVGSLLFHALVFSFLATLPNKEASLPVSVTSVRVTALSQKSEVATPIPRREPEKPMPNLKQPTRKPRARQDVRELRKTQNPPEIRGGLSQSTALPGTGKPSFAIAEGNSAEKAVDPEAARKPAPPAVVEAVTPSSENISETPVAEAQVDQKAECPGRMPVLNLTEDAINAGVTSGKVVVRVTIGVSGAVESAVVRKGTGYQIDAQAVAAAKKITCKPALLKGRPHAVVRDFVWEVVLD